MAKEEKNKYDLDSPQYQLRDIITSETSKARAFDADVDNYKKKARDAWNKVEKYQAALDKLDADNSDISK